MAKFTSHIRKNSRTKCIIIPARRVGDSNFDQKLAMFYINPSTWSESKTTNWVKHQVPGRSDPHQQWISGGPRTITFDALVTNDLIEGSIQNKPKDETAACLSKGVRGFFSQTAAKIFNIPELSINESLGANNNSRSTLELGITHKLNYYRSLVYPNANRNRVHSAPDTVRLLVGSTFGNRTREALFVVDKVSIKITKQYADLTPIEAVVSFSLTEIVDKVLSSDTDILRVS